jgi:hypothetical protein
MIKLVTDMDDGNGFWYVVVYDESETVLFFRPGFRTQEEAERAGDAWIKENLGGMPDPRLN